MKYLLIIILFTLLGCNSKSSKIEFEKNTHSNVNKILETFVSVPLEMRKIGNIVFVTDFRSDSLLFCYDIKKRTIIKRLLPRGKGPNEFLSPVQLIFLDSLALIHNRWHFSARYFKIDLLKLNFTPFGEIVRFSTDIDMVYPLSDKRFIASGRFKDGRFAILNECGKILSYCGDYPQYNHDEINVPNFPKFMFHQSMFGYKAKQKCLTSVTSHVLELWSYSDDTLTLKKRILLSPYKYKYSMGDGLANANEDDNDEKGVQRIYTTDNYIYMLYDSNTEKMAQKSEDKNNNEIWIFDWNGSPIQKIHINSKIKCFCVDESENKIYCIINNPEPSIGSFNI
ncbi:BF3164 family lipoprotein [Phocaeicola paurosaccharolyticus]|jgi:hypothetical protein|uniref:BF3164 family lipoprotein n=1 Tax=Phocaeicola paurosaccharolyticus TaxID=732242 RepID=UPI000469FFA4|nr:BF3164 family lipoprotein [Phocaeicola paurosaccharolyticus]